MGDDCPSIESLAAYIDHNLTVNERERIEAHLICCPPCRKTIALVIKSQATVPDPVLPDPTN